MAQSKSFISIAVQDTTWVVDVRDNIGTCSSFQKRADSGWVPMMKSEVHLNAPNVVSHPQETRAIHL